MSVQKTTIEVLWRQTINRKAGVPVKYTVLSQGLSPAPREVYTHTQSLAALIWTVNHNLNFQPITEVHSVGGQKLLAEVNYLNLNTLQVVFNVPQAGTARMV